MASSFSVLLCTSASVISDVLYSMLTSFLCYLHHWTGTPYRIKPLLINSCLHYWMPFLPLLRLSDCSDGLLLVPYLFPVLSLLYLLWDRAPTCNHGVACLCMLGWNIYACERFDRSFFIFYSCLHAYTGRLVLYRGRKELYTLSTVFFFVVCLLA